MWHRGTISKTCEKKNEEWYDTRIEATIWTDKAWYNDEDCEGGKMEV